MAKIVRSFKLSAIDHVFRASQRQKANDLSGMIIVESAIFRSTLESLTDEQLKRLLIDYPIMPATNELNDVSNWCSLYFDMLLQVDDKIKTQTDFGEAVGLSQGDVSSLMNARKGFYFGAERIETLFSSVKTLVSALIKKAS